MKLIFIILIATIVTSSCGAPVYDIAPADDPDRIGASALEVSGYINYYAHNRVDIREMKVAEKEGNYFLLASGNDNWVYILPLRESGNTLKLKRVKSLNACKTGAMDIDQFNFEEGEITGCRNSDHKIMGG